MKIGIVAALETELKYLKDILENEENLKYGEQKFVKGNIGNYKIYLAHMSIGKVNATLTTQALIDAVSPDLIINTGIAGSLQDNISILDTIISNKLFYHDIDAKLFEKYPPFKSTFEADEKWIERINQIAQKLNYNCKIGKIATGDQFIASNKYKEKIRSSGALCVEMEGCAVAHTAFVNNIPFVVLRSISDNADDMAEINYNEFETLAANRSAKLLSELFRTEF